MNVRNTLKNYYNDLVELGYNPLCVCVAGSQNYNLADEQSDIDAIAWVFPKFSEMLDGFSLISSEVAMSNGHCTVFDIRKLVKVFRDGDFIHYIPFFDETFVNPFYEKDWWEFLGIVEMLGDFNVGEMLRKMMGMCFSNIKLIRKEELGENYKTNKALSYILWIEVFFKQLFAKQLPAEGNYVFQMGQADRNWIMKIKRGELMVSQSYAIDYAESVTANIQQTYVKMADTGYEPIWDNLIRLEKWREMVMMKEHGLTSIKED